LTNTCLLLLNIFRPKGAMLIIVKHSINDFILFSWEMLTSVPRHWLRILKKKIIYSLRPKLYVALEKKFVSNYMSLYNTNATLMLLFLL